MNGAYLGVGERFVAPSEVTESGFAQLLALVLSKVQLATTSVLAIKPVSLFVFWVKIMIAKRRWRRTSSICFRNAPIWPFRPHRSISEVFAAIWFQD